MHEKCDFYFQVVFFYFACCNAANGLHLFSFSSTQKNSLNTVQHPAIRISNENTVASSAFIFQFYAQNLPIATKKTTKSQPAHDKMVLHWTRRHAKSVSIIFAVKCEELKSARRRLQMRIEICRHEKDASKYFCGCQAASLAERAYVLGNGWYTHARWS